MSKTLDALVAERVFGRKFWAETRGEYTAAVMDYNGAEPWKSSRQEYWASHSKRYRPITSTEAASMGFFGTGCADYSGNIKAAWEVAEENGVGFIQLDNGDREVNGERVSGWMYRYVGVGEHGEATESTVPMAICVALLRAKGVPEATIEKARGV